MGSGREVGIGVGGIGSGVITDRVGSAVITISVGGNSSVAIALLQEQRLRNRKIDKTKSLLFLNIFLQSV